MLGEIRYDRVATVQSRLKIINGFDYLEVYVFERFGSKTIGGEQN